MTARQPLAAQARERMRAGDTAGAKALLGTLVGEVTGDTVDSVHVNADRYSLNSLNGTVRLRGREPMFFKYHHEEGEEATIAEYYNAELLRDAGYAVDIPLFACREPGRQILLYRQRAEPRLADVCRELDLVPDAVRAAQVMAAQRASDELVAERMLATLRPGDADAVATEPIHQLFHHRLGGGFEGRVAQFYVDREFRLGATVFTWPELRDATWVVNGVRYRLTLGELLAEAGRVLDPLAIADHGVVTAHGDAHNANVWYESTEDGGRAVFFDPAFAGAQVPALLAEVKATFHNIFAHPLWLYEPRQASARYRVDVTRVGGEIHVTHDWALTPLRAAFWESKKTLVWAPLLARLDADCRLPGHWERIVRLALFCCPTLVMDLRAGGAGGHTPASSALAFAIAVMAGSEPVEGGDVLSEGFATLAPRR